MKTRGGVARLYDAVQHGRLDEKSAAPIALGHVELGVPSTYQRAPAPRALEPGALLLRNRVVPHWLSATVAVLRRGEVPRAARRASARGDGATAVRARPRTDVQVSAARRAIEAPDLQGRRWARARSVFLAGSHDASAREADDRIAHAGESTASGDAMLAMFIETQERSKGLANHDPSQY